MNHLAHLLLARRTGTSPSGALLADALRHLPQARFPREFEAAVRLHHAVDDFTDRHPSFRRSCRRLGDGPRHYRGVLIDIYYDHCLALRWQRYADEGYRDFTEGTYAELRDELGRSDWPDAPWVARMIAADWLSGLRTPDGVAATIGRMRGRARRSALLEDATERLTAAHDGLRDDFDRFFPDLLDHVDRIRAEPDLDGPDRRKTG